MGSILSRELEGRRARSGGAIGGEFVSTRDGNRQWSVEELLYMCIALRKSFPGIPEPILQNVIDFSGIVGVVYTRSMQCSEGGDNENRLHLVYTISPRIDRHLFRPMRIVVTVESCDQGWTSYPEMRGRRQSHTFGELCVDDERFPCYRNIAASSTFERQSIEFSADSLIMRKICSTWVASIGRKLNIELWVRSQYPGWKNRIRFADISVFWGLNVCNLIEKYAQSPIRRDER